MRWTCLRNAFFPFASPLRGRADVLAPTSFQKAVPVGGILADILQASRKLKTKFVQVPSPPKVSMWTMVFSISRAYVLKQIMLTSTHVGWKMRGPQETFSKGVIEPQSGFSVEASREKQMSRMDMSKRIGAMARESGCCRRNRSQESGRWKWRRIQN